MAGKNWFGKEDFLPGDIIFFDASPVNGENSVNFVLEKKGNEFVIQTFDLGQKNKFVIEGILVVTDSIRYHKKWTTLWRPSTTSKQQETKK